ncbi:MAG: FAD-binding oxidoreductase [Actinomycetota bacterium]|nr:FAD-binding oxidoreductase [Actinomycetota bacterium]
MWFDGLEEQVTPRPALAGGVDVDVAIVGAGYTGLWTAYYLLSLDPKLRIAILEQEVAGFGASGRNGGWCSALFAPGNDKVGRVYGRDAAIAMQRAMIDTLDEIEAVLDREGLDARWRRGGTLTLVASPAHEARIKREVEDAPRWGLSVDDYRWLDAPEARERIGAIGVTGAAYTPHCAAIDPARLVRGLARVVEAKGATIYERTAARSIDPGVVATDGGFVRAATIVRATEGYTARLARYRRTLVPLYSLMIATERLPADVWSAIGWDGYETITDGRHLLIYAQRTADDRIAIGGRGAPYHYGSRVVDDFDRDPHVFAELEKVLRELFPAVAGARITHHWGGPLGVPRDWFTSVGIDRSTGIAWAQGYVGDGVSTTNLAGRTLADLIVGRDSELTKLPWARHVSKDWEPEPLRWLGINLALKAMSSADRAERRTKKPAKRAEVLGRLIGR